MIDSRRRFVIATGASLLGLAMPAVSRAASAASARVYVSKLPIRRIARELVFGVGHEVLRYVRGLDPARVQSFLAALKTGRFEARVPTLRQEIDVAFDNVEFTANGNSLKEEVGKYVVALQGLTEEDANVHLDAAEAAELKGLVEDAGRQIRQDIENDVTLRLSYRVQYRNAHFQVVKLAHRHNFRVELTLLAPVRIFNGAQFVADLQEQGSETRVYSSLWADVCTGRREGPIVRRIAEREIRCREAAFLAEVEYEVIQLVNNTGQSRLSRMIPELVRRIADG
jgi:hypothetical protein